MVFSILLCVCSISVSFFLLKSTFINKNKIKCSPRNDSYSNNKTAGPVGSVATEPDWKSECQGFNFHRRLLRSRTLLMFDMQSGSIAS